MGYRSAGTRSKVVIGLLAAGATLDAIAILSGLSQLSLLKAVLAGTPPTVAAAHANDLRQQIIGLIQILLFLATAVAFLVWIHRAYSNLEPLDDRDRKYTPAWAVGYYFIPFLNLVRPFQIMREIWNASLPVIDDQDSPSAREIRMSSTPSPVIGWWSLYLLSGVAGQVSLRMSLGAKTLPELISATYSQIANDTAGIVSALFAIYVVRTVTRMQDERHALISAAQAPAATEGFVGGASPAPTGLV